MIHKFRDCFPKLILLLLAISHFVTTDISIYIFLHYIFANILTFISCWNTLNFIRRLTMIVHHHNQIIYLLLVRILSWITRFIFWYSLVLLFSIVLFPLKEFLFQLFLKGKSSNGTFPQLLLIEKKKIFSFPSFFWAIGFTPSHSYCTFGWVILNTLP